MAPRTLPHPRLLDRVPRLGHLPRIDIANMPALLIARQLAGVAAIAALDGGKAAARAGLVHEAVEALLGGRVVDVEDPGVGVKAAAAVEGVVDCDFDGGAILGHGELGLAWGGVSVGRVVKRGWEYRIPRGSYR